MTALKPTPVVQDPPAPATAITHDDLHQAIAEAIAAVVPAPALDDGTVHMTCRMWREFGRWAIELTGPYWVSTDILIEVNEAAQVYVEPFDHPVDPGLQTVVLRFLRKGETRDVKRS